MPLGRERLAILDWFHLKENLYKVGGSLKRLCQAEALLWQGKLDQTIDLFKELRSLSLPTDFVAICRPTALASPTMTTTRAKASRLALAPLSP
jgi:hypothetical protein